MRKLSMVCAAVLFAGFIAGEAKAQDTVTSVNVVGFSTEPLPDADWIMVSPPFTQVDGTTNTLQSLFSTNQLTQAGNYLNCDRVVFWDAQSQSYKYYAQYIDGNFYDAGSLSEWDNSPIRNPELPVGVAVWIAPSALPDSGKDLTFSGEVVSDATQSVDIVAGFQLISYPFSSEIILNDLDFFNDGATANANYLAADRIVVWNGTSYQAYALYIDGNWYPANDLAEWDSSSPATGVTVDLNRGFWYDAKSPFTWTETNKYLSNL